MMLKKIDDAVNKFEGTVNGSLLCMEHGGDAESMAQLTLISTAASMITIPLIAAALL